MAVTKTQPSWWDNCDNCGWKVGESRICTNCGHRNSSLEHTYMAYGNTDKSGYYAIVAENVQWADDRDPDEVSIHAHRQRVAETLQMCGLPTNW
jgi:hypothetical protein